MRGTIDLSSHKLANVYRAPAKRERWKAYKPPHKRDDVYRQLVRLVDGAVRDAFANHPEYLTKPGQRNARASIVKRAAGALWGYGKETSFAAKAARGRSVVAVDTPLLAAAERETGACQKTSSLTVGLCNKEPDQTTFSDVALGGGAVSNVSADIHIGIWRMRNARIVEIEKRLTLACKGPDGPFFHDVWAGHCLCCNSKFTWEIDGRYAAIGEHEFDLVEKAMSEKGQSDISEILGEIASSGPALTKHSKKLNAILTHFSEKKIPLSVCADKRHLNRKVATLKKRARHLGLSFPDYTPRAKAETKEIDP